jgi:hypothetical protein
MIRRHGRRWKVKGCNQHALMRRSICFPREHERMTMLRADHRRRIMGACLAFPERRQLASSPPTSQSQLLCLIRELAVSAANEARTLASPLDLVHLDSTRDRGLWRGLGAESRQRVRSHWTLAVWRAGCRHVLSKAGRLHSRHSG